MNYTSDNIDKSTFVKRLIIIVKDIYGAHLKLFISDKRPDSSFDEYGDEREKKAKRIFKRYSMLQDHLEKLEKTPIFIETQELIPILNDKGIEEVEYYQYIFENFIIRVTSTLDLCGKLGNEVFDLQIPEKYCNWYSFATHNTLNGTDTSKTLTEFADYLDQTKDDRHIIIHSGGYESEAVKSIDSKIYELNDIVPLDALLQNWFDTEKEKELKNQIDMMKKRITTSIDYTIQFFDTLDNKLKDVEKRE